MLNTRILARRVLPNENSVDVLIWSLEPFDRNARTDVCEEVEGPTEGQVQGDVALANWPPVRAGLMEDMSKTH